MELWTSSVKKDREEAQALHRDWQDAQARIMTEMTAKLAHYSQLPWKLLGLAHHHPGPAAAAAQACLQLWEQQGVGCKHRQSRRFLDPLYPGTSSDPGLRKYVQRMAAGENIMEDEFIPLRRWLCKFSTIKLAERTVEGYHSIITKIMKRAPASGIGYISTELRFPAVWERLSSDPQVTCHHLVICCSYI